MINAPCPSWNAQTSVCDKGTDCRCVDGVDNPIVDFFPASTSTTISDEERDMLIIPFEPPKHLDGGWWEPVAKREHANRRNPAKGVKNFVVGCLLFWAGIGLVWWLK